MTRSLRIVSAERMRAIEARCFDAGLPPIALMESAGRAVAAHALGREPERVTVVCGKGNNGADGMVAARTLHAQGVRVRVCFAHPPSGELGLLQRRLLDRSGVETGNELDVAGADLVIDALLGIGGRQPLDAETARWVELLNARARFVLALDVPSGVCAGFREGQLAVRAHETVTFHAHKTELAMLPARAYAGELIIADIGIPEALFEAHDGVVIDAAYVRRHLVVGSKGGRADVHKGTFGHVAVFGGAAGMEGAQILAALAAARSGAGLVTAIGAGGSARKAPPEIMRAETAADLRRYTAACLGPGLGRAHDEALLDLLARFERPAAIDADALNALADLPDWPSRLGPGPRVLTPHPLEFARLFQSEVTAVQNDRIGAAQRAAKESGAIVVLKGPNTVVAAPDGRFGISASGGRELAKGGSGDVLAGMIAAFLAARAYAGDAFSAAALGVYLHGAAGAHAAGKAGARASVLASDIIAAIPAALAPFGA